MLWYNDILCVESAWLICNHVLTQANYNFLTATKKIEVVRRGCYCTPALVAYDSLPERFKQYIKDLGVNPYEAAKENAIEKLLEHNTEASEYYASFTTADNKSLPVNKRREYYANAMVLDACRRFEISHSGYRKKLGGNRQRVISFMCDAVKLINKKESFPFNLPDNARAFERKYKEYLRSGYDSLIHNAYKNGKKNAAVVTKEGEQVLITMFAHHNNLNNEQVAMLYGEFARVQGWKPLSASAVAV